MDATGRETNEFERQCRVMSFFMDNAKTYIQLSIGALVLSVSFLHEVLGVSQEKQFQPDWLLVSSWIFFLLAAVLGAFYQYLAAKFLEWKSGVPRHHYRRLQWLIESPGYIYGGMLAGFYFGAVSFTVAAVKRL